MKTLILLILTLFILHIFSHAAPILITQMNHSSILNHTQQHIYVPRLDGPDSGPFRKCNTMSFDVRAPEPCMRKICKLYLFRNGTDGWMPETVAAYDYHYPPVIFNYNFFISEGPGVGHNYCRKS
ncbi:hypothetical protein KIW84_058285 [Lathyrus oleraceus]|uniref:Uncharacterized protein n=1 Tax=Pisum sativum TaxID=3888 RepID=A0A9D5AP61_PEA|nr:hypothetical protein KIW84_058285 [Pisum sativum]